VMKPALKLMIIGCGSIGERHIKNLQSLGAGEIAASDPSRERLEYIKNTCGVETFPSYEEALAKSTFDAVLVCSPTSEHIPPALAAVRRGCHVFVEKPLSHTMEGVDELIHEAAHRKVALITGFNYRFHPELQQIKSLLDNNEIGKPFSARAHFGSYFLYRLPFHAGNDYRQDYAGKKIGGGVILDAAIHLIDYLCWFMGEVEEVYCRAENLSDFDLEAEDFAEIILKFKGGPVASVHADFIQKPYQNKLEIAGQGGTIAWSLTGGRVLLSPAEPERPEEQWRNIEVANRSADMYLEEMKSFIRHIQGEPTPAADGIAGRRALEVALAAKKSAVTGKIVKL
jgi:predicted dehydrogenase